jgi:hypothetical protein
MTLVGRIVRTLALVLAALPAAAAPPAATALLTVLANFARSVPTDQFEQISAAIGASPQLATRLGDLAQSGALTAIVVAPAPTGSPFNATADDARISIAPSLLTALARQRLFDVVQDDDVLPNNTVFVLAHLVHHLENPAAFRFPAPGGSIDRTTWVDARLKAEAAAFLDAWNVTVDEATRRHGAPLSGRQVASVLLNLRYRFVFTVVRQKLKFEPDGSISIDDASIAVVADRLKSSRLSDLE